MRWLRKPIITIPLFALPWALITIQPWNIGKWEKWGWGWKELLVRGIEGYGIGLSTQSFLFLLTSKGKSRRKT
jgi:hypothetical protein